MIVFRSVCTLRPSPAVQLKLISLDCCEGGLEKNLGYGSMMLAKTNMVFFTAAFVIS